jgi:acetolactate synthase-1/2/3 large subunit
VNPQVNGVDLTQAMLHLADVLPRNAIVTNGAGNYAVWLHRFYQYRAPRTELATTCGAMGYGLPAAIAAALRHQDRPVVCVAGDGCFMMYPQELATAVEYGASLTVLVANNGMYGTIRMHQERDYPGRVSGTSLKGPDYTALARSFGAHAERVTSAQDFPAAFARAQAAGGVALIELVTDPLQITPDKRII